MRDVTDETFDTEVLGSGTPTVVDFWAPWCGPCRAVAPVLEQLEAEHGGRLAFAKLDVDENPEVAARYGVLSIPTVMLFAEGERKQELIGAYPRSKYQSAFADYL